MVPVHPHVIVLFGATGDLARRKLLPALLHLYRAGLLPECRIVGTSIDDLDDDGFRAHARKACEEFTPGRVSDETPPDVEIYPQGSWGRIAARKLVAPYTWRLPFERAWRSAR